MYVEERMDEQNVVYPFSGRPCDKEKNEPVLHVIKQMKLQNIFLHIIRLHLYKMSRKGKSIETERD